MTMEHVDSDIAAVAFCRKGAEGEKTKLFEDLPVSAKELISGSAGLFPDEEPIFACFHSASDWFLVTTRRLLWPVRGGVDGFQIVNLSEVDNDLEEMLEEWLEDLAKKGLWPPTGEMFEQQRFPPEYGETHPSRTIQELHIKTIDGDSKTITLEPGGSYFGVWNTLLWLCRWARSRREKC